MDPLYAYLQRQVWTHQLPVTLGLPSAQGVAVTTDFGRTVHFQSTREIDLFIQGFQLGEASVLQGSNDEFTVPPPVEEQQ